MKKPPQTNIYNFVKKVKQSSLRLMSSVLIGILSSTTLASQVNIKGTNNPDRSDPVAAHILNSKYHAAFASLPGTALRGKTAATRVFGQIMLSPKIASTFIPYWASSKKNLNLTSKQQELIILRTAYVYRSNYVWGHHVPAALQAGISKQEIKQVCLPVKEMDLPSKDKILLQASDEIMAKANVRSSTWKKLKVYYTDPQVLDIITVLSQYLVFNAVNNVFGIRLENNLMPRLCHID